jgi:hypothetical protein
MQVEVLFDYNPNCSMRDAVAPYDIPSTSTPGFHVGHMVLDGSMSDRLAVCQLSPGMDGYLVAAEAEAVPDVLQTGAMSDAAEAPAGSPGRAAVPSIADLGSLPGETGGSREGLPMEVDGIARGGSPVTLRMPVGSPARQPSLAPSPSRVPGTSPRPPVTAALAAAHALAGMGPGAAAVVPLCGAPSLEASTEATTGNGTGSGLYSTDSPTSSGRSSDDAVQLPVGRGGVSGMGASADAGVGAHAGNGQTAAGPDHCAPLLGGAGAYSNTCTAAGLGGSAGTALAPSRVTYPMLHTLQLAALRADLVPSWSGLLLPQVLPAIRVLHLHTGACPVPQYTRAIHHENCFSAMPGALGVLYNVGCNSALTTT